MLAAILAALTLLFADDELTAEARKRLKYSWVGTHTGAAVETRPIGTTLVRLTATVISLPVLDPDFDSGGGAILPVGQRILVAERTGRFFEVRLNGAATTVQLLPLRLDLHEDALRAYAEAHGYTIRPGKNLGMAGHTTRVHDLYAVEGERLWAATYTYWNAEEDCATLRLATIEASDDWRRAQEVDWRVVFESRPCLPFTENRDKPFAGQQAGGRVVESAPGKLLLTVGDFKRDGVHAPALPQDMTADYGKLIEIDLASGAAEVVSIGHRNPQGLTVDDAGRVWSTEHGPQGGDELNLIARGRNYGWPLVTLGTECGGCGWQLEGRHDGYAEPLYSWLPSIGVSNLIEVRDFAPQWDGDLLVASLVNQSLHRLHLRDGRVQYDESIFMNERIRDIAQMEDGSILLWTDTGKLVLLAPAREPSPSARLTAALQAPTKAILADCAECHGLDEGDARAAKISLWGVFGRPIAAGDARLYSTVMKETAGEWDEATLDRFLADPAAMVPGTTMQYSGIADPETRRQVVEFLKELK